MTDMNQIKDTLNLEDKDMKKLPSTLNVLTILTYIGCALGAISNIWNWIQAGSAMKLYEQLGDLGGNTGNSALDKMMDAGLSLAKKQFENRHLLLIAGLLCIGLCFYGAMQMRNLKKTGFYIYTVGELLYPILYLVLIGGGIFASLATGLSLIVGIVFVILYFTQTKHMS
jgi:hypothetical protein